MLTGALYKGQMGDVGKLIDDAPLAYIVNRVNRVTKQQGQYNG